MRGPSSDGTFASKGGQGTGNCGHTYVGQTDSYRPEILLRLHVLQGDDRWGINRGHGIRTREPPAVCLPVSPQGRSGSSVSWRT